MKIAIYACDGAAGLSASEQVRRTKEWAKRHGHSVVKIHRDGAPLNRRAWQRMHGAAVSSDHPYDAVAAYSRSCISTANARVANVERQLSLKDVAVVTVRPNKEKDVSEAAVLRNIVGAVDEYMRRLRGQAISRAMRRAARRRRAAASAKS